MKLKLTDEQFSEIDYHIEGIKKSAKRDPGDYCYDLKLDYVSLRPNSGNNLMVDVQGTCKSAWFDNAHTEIPVSKNTELGFIMAEWDFISYCYSEMSEWCEENKIEIKEVTIEKSKKKRVLSFLTEWEDEKNIYTKVWEYEI